MKAQEALIKANKKYYINRVVIAYKVCKLNKIKAQKKNSVKQRIKYKIIS
jgi:hypothetical protein